MGEPSLLGLELIYKTLEKVHIIRNLLQMAYSRQKSFADNRRMDLEFEEGDNVNLKISPIKGVVRFGKKGNLVLIMWVPMKFCKRLVRLPMN